MISISTVYNTLKSLANEDQKGFITPYTFNSMAALGQMNVYNEIMSGGFEGTRLTNSRSDVRGASSRLNSNKQHKSYYTSIASLVPDSNPVTPNAYVLPEKMNKAISVLHTLSSNGSQVSTFDIDFNSVRIPIERDFDKIYLIRKNLDRGLYLGEMNYTSGAVLSGQAAVAPSEQDPSIVNPNNIVFFINDKMGYLMGAPNYLFTYPNLNLTYLRYPGSVKESGLKVVNNPSLGVNQVNAPDPYSGFDNFVINDANSFNFDLPEAFLGDIVNEMAKLIGVQLEETMVYQYGAAEEAGNEKKQLN